MFQKTYDGSLRLFALFQQISDPRHAHGKRYSLTTLLVIIFLAKLSGKDKPMEIADWAHKHAQELADLLGLKRLWMPHHNTIRRVFQEILDEAEFDRLAHTYSQSETSVEGEQLAIDGKALRGTRIIGQAESEYVLGVYNVNTQQVVAQVAVGSKENEITVAPRAIEGLAIAGKVFTGDALHTQRAISEQIVQLEAITCGRSRKTSRDCMKISPVCLPLTNRNLALARLKRIF